MSTIRRNAVANLAGRVATAVLWVAVTPFVLALLGPERFGIWALFFAFTAYLSAFDLGIGNTMIQFIAVERAAGDRRGVERTLGKGLRLSLALGMVWAVVVVAARGTLTEAFHVPAPLIPETLEALLVLAVGSLLLQPVQVLTGSLQGFERLDLSNTCVFAGVAAHVTALYLGLAGGGGLREVAMAGVVGQLVTGLLASVLLRTQLARVPSLTQSMGTSWRELLHFGAALQLTNVLAVLQVQSGKIILGLLGTLAMVTDYELGLRVASGVAGLPLLILGTVAPTVTRTWISDGPAAVGALFTSTLRWLYTLSVIALGLLWLIAPDVTRVWLGPGHDRIAMLIRLWVLSYGMNLAWSLGAAFARSVGKPWIEVGSLAMSLVTNIALGLWCVPRYGTVGAVAVLALSYGAGFLTFAATSPRAGIPFGPWITRELAPRVLLAAGTVALSAGLLAAGRVSGVLPPPGLIHGVIAGLLFLALFALCFLAVGDTQRLAIVARQIAAGAMGGRGARQL